MHTNYKIQFFTFIINIFMALSLNSFSSLSVFLPALFLYFISNLASFLDKAWYYNENGFRCEKIISFIGFIICLIFACFYVAHTLNFIEIVFCMSNNNYKILMQGISNSFFTFHSVDITLVITIFVLFMPVASLLLCIIPFLSCHGYTKTNLFNILKENKRIVRINIFFSIVIGLIGILICFIKSSIFSNGFGTPQYHRYFFALGTAALIISFSLLIIRKRPK